MRVKMLHPGSLVIDWVNSKVIPCCVLTHSNSYTILGYSMFMKHTPSRLQGWPRVAAAILVLSLLPAVAFSQTSIDEVTQAGEDRADAGAAQQEQVEQVADETLAVVSEFKTVAKVVDGLKVYNSLLQRQVDNQLAEMTALSTSIDNVALIERQIVPLMTRMIDSLEAFIQLDMPFLLDEREERIAKLRDMMEQIGRAHV